MSEWKKITQAVYELPREGGMRVPGLVIATEDLMESPEIWKPLEQVRNVAHLPGIVGYSIAMPDIHWGYGFPIGGVAAVDVETGVISPGGVGYDINCGVRLAVVPMPFASIADQQQERLLQDIFQRVPSGVGESHKRTIGLTEEDYCQLTQKGAQWSVEHGYGLQDDLEFCESRGVLANADSRVVSAIAKERGSKQLGTIGSGNHFIEIGYVDTLYLPDIAQRWGIQAGQTYILIHSGSRGFGHQICQDTLNLFTREGLGKELPDPQLIAAPIRSSLGQNYLHAMAAAANYAFNNRQQILHHVRESFRHILGTAPQEIRLIYDVCHNIAKMEEYEVHGVKKTLCVHRKGATRAYGPGATELAPLYQETGQPVLVPGDMGRASHIMVGQGNALTWCSACHGAGRARSRHQSLREWRHKNILDYMKGHGIHVKAKSIQTIAEEMPDAYKDVDRVVQAVQEAGLARMVAKLRPRLVIKG